jgi:uncharacterized RDD family membrane protein YckC
MPRDPGADPASARGDGSGDAGGRAASARGPAGSDDGPADSSGDAGGAPAALPESGPGSLAGWGRRLLALAVDWALANVVAVGLAGPDVWDASTGLTWVPLLAWTVLVWLSTGLTGASLGQHVLRLRVVRLDRRPVGLLRGLLRTLLIALVVPPLVTVRGRGLHDVAVHTAVVNGPR